MVRRARPGGVGEVGECTPGAATLELGEVLSGGSDLVVEGFGRDRERGKRKDQKSMYEIEGERWTRSLTQVVKPYELTKLKGMDLAVSISPAALLGQL